MNNTRWLAIILGLTALALLLGCSNSTDARTATTADLLAPGRFEEANERRRSTLEDIRQERAEAETKHAALTDRLRDQERAMELARTNLAVAREQVDDLREEIAALESERQAKQTELDQLDQRRAALREQLQEVQIREQRVEELAVAVQALRTTIQQRTELERETATQR